MKNFQHFILTRFNIPFIRESNIDFLFDDKYLSERFSIFLKYCYPSIVNQSNQNFLWLVFFDDRTPQKYKKINEGLAIKYPRYKPIYINFSDLLFDKNINNYYFNILNKSIYNLSYSETITKVLLPNYITKYIGKYLSVDTEYIITTRIDNDDAFHKDMIKNVQNVYIDKQQEKIISFDIGLQYVNATYILQTYLYPNNHFLSYIEKKSTHLHTILYWDHFFIEKYKKVYHIKTIPLWLEIVHRTNVKNSLVISRNNKLIFTNSNLSSFGIDIKWSFCQTFFDIIFKPKVYIYLLIIKIVKRICVRKKG